MNFVLVDEILELDPGRRALARKVFSSDDDYLADHFPGFPVVPGVLLTEAMGQTGGWLILHHLDFSRLVLLVMVQHAKFRQLVLPGQEVLLEAELETVGDADFVARCRARVGQRVVADARLAYRGFPLPRAPEVADQLTGWARSTWARLRPGAP